MSFKLHSALCRVVRMVLCVRSIAVGIAIKAVCRLVDIPSGCDKFSLMECVRAHASLHTNSIVLIDLNSVNRAELREIV